MAGAVSEKTAGVAQNPGNDAVIAKTANFTVNAADVGLNTESIAYDLSLNTTVGVTATIPLNATMPFAIGQRITFLQGATGTTVVTATGGVTLVGRSATVAASTGATLIKIGVDKWFLF